MASLTLKCGKTVLLEDGDLEIVSKYKWRESPLGYAITTCTKAILMHRLILCAPKGLPVDHINHNTLDNRRINLRICTHAENMKNRRMHKNNSVGLKGVCMEKGMYRARITTDGKKTSLGVYKTAEAAHEAYVMAAKKFHGEFSSFN